MKYRNSSRVTLEEKLEARAALWSPAKRLEMARMLERWARQLRVSAKIMLRDLNYQQPAKNIRRLSARKLALN